MSNHVSILRCAECELQCDRLGENAGRSIAAHMGHGAELPACPRESASTLFDFVPMAEHRRRSVALGSRIVMGAHGGRLPIGV